MFFILKNLLHRKVSDGSQPGTRLVHHRPEAQVEPPGTGPHHVPRAEAPLTHHPARLLQDVLTGSPRERSDAQRDAGLQRCAGLSSGTEGPPGPAEAGSAAAGDWGPCSHRPGCCHKPSDTCTRALQCVVWDSADSAADENAAGRSGLHFRDLGAGKEVPIPVLLLEVPSAGRSCGRSTGWLWGWTVGTCASERWVAGSDLQGAGLVLGLEGRILRDTPRPSWEMDGQLQASRRLPGPHSNNER